MFGISGAEAIFILIVALVVIGPERLPEYAQKLKEFIRAAKRYATGAREDLRETLGPEFSDVDWRKLDPRQYDPRVIVREALLEDDEQRPTHGSTSATAPPGPGAARPEWLAPGQRPPFDPEAT